MFSWLPVDTMAKATVEISLNPKVPSTTVCHVQNPRLFSWSDDFLPNLRKSGLKFSTVDQREWVELLRQSDQDPATNPTVKLLQYYSERYDRKPQADYTKFEVTNACQWSPALASAPQVDGKLTSTFVKYWKSQNMI